MRYVALATDFDGTIATEGRVDRPTLAALQRFSASGRALILVTGRRLDDLQSVFSNLGLFDRVVVENGAVVFSPKTQTVRALEEPPPARFVEELRARGVTPLSMGRVIVATWQPHEATVLDTIRAMGLELQVEFNKGAVMVLPAGVTKRTGLTAAAADLGISLHNIVGVGDAENDHAFLSACGCAVSVENALPSLKERSDMVTQGARGAGVAELIDRILADELATVATHRAELRIGHYADGRDFSIQGTPNVLIVGPSASGKSTIATAFVERLLDHGYQLCLIDPEGDHELLGSMASIGSADHAPSVEAIERLLADPHHSVVASLLAIPLEDRPRWFGGMFAAIRDLRAKAGRPHWLIVDEAHHVMPANSVQPMLGGSCGVVLITVDAASVSHAVLGAVDLVLTPSHGAADSLRATAHARKAAAPMIVGERSAVAWRLGSPRAEAIDLLPPRHPHLRHRRKYARGDVGEDKSFFFRGPNGALNLRAQNLALFVQIASGVDDETWLHHLRSGDYSRWFREAIKDAELAAETERIEAACEKLSAAESRERIRQSIEDRYTLPA